MIAVPLAVEDANLRLSDIFDGVDIGVEESVNNRSEYIPKYWRASLVFVWCNQSTPHRILKYLLVVLYCLLNTFHLTMYF